MESVVTQPQSRPDVLSFGIPSLDRLIGYPGERGEDTDRNRYGYSLGSVSAANSTSRPLSTEAATLCIIGPDGTGKSLFSLHLASDYWRRTRTAAQPPRIVYASCDLSYERAHRVWRSFWLDRPHSRYCRLPFEREWLRSNNGRASRLLAWERTELAPHNRLRLERYSPADDAEKLTRYLTGRRQDFQEVAFLDLAAATSGDDWAFLHSLLAVMEYPRDGVPRHLLIVDAVEGLETLVGERDAFGQDQSRRARIAQIVRAAAAKCHLAFVVEEPKDGERLPEVFVADLVLRLRSDTDRDYARRTVELEKVRGQRHVRGQHDFRIRQEGTKTGETYNPDDPWVGLPNDPMAFIQIYPSLHYLTREIGTPPPREPRAPQPPSPLTQLEEFPKTPANWRFASFGIHQLDSILWRARDPEYLLDLPPNVRNSTSLVTQATKALRRLVGPEARTFLSQYSPSQQARIWNDLSGIASESLPYPVAGFDRMGLPLGTVTTLIGNDSTYKSQLARAFLSQCFRTRHELGSESAHLRLAAANSHDPLLGQGVAVILASFNTNRQRQAELLRRHLIRSQDRGRRGSRLQEMGLTHRLIVRSLDPHHLPSALLVHVIQQLVQEAQRLLHAPFSPIDDVAEERLHRHLRNGRIRLVIDDWSTILAMYPEVKRDPLVLPYLMNYLRHEGITTLIVATRSGHPNTHLSEDLSPEIRELRAMADHHLDTWHVSFFDERRVAISAQPSPLPGVGVQVRELRPGRIAELPANRLCEPPPSSTSKGIAASPSLSEKALHDRNEMYDLESLIVDPHFELYTGLQDGRPAPVPLEVHLFAEREDVQLFQAYLNEIRELFRHLFGHDRQRTVLHPHYGNSYDILREISYLKSEARLDHSLVLQVDEFWAESRSELCRQDRYLFAKTVDRSRKQGSPHLPTPDRTEDPFGLFQLSDSLSARIEQNEPRPLQSTGPLDRASFFDLIGYDLRQAAKRYPIDKVPYSWDFGFLVCNTLAWDRALDESDRKTAYIGRKGKPISQTVREIWNRLWKISPSSYGIQPGLMEDTPRPENLLPLAHWTQTTRQVDTRRNLLHIEWVDIMGDPPKRPGTVGHDTSQVQPNPVTWREFLGACVKVSEATHGEFEVFDVDLIAPESLACLVLEIWFSEVFQSIKHFQSVKNSARRHFVEELKQSPWWPRNQRDDLRSVSLKKLLGTDDRYQFGKLYRRALYRTFLLLNEALDQEQLRDRSLAVESRPASSTAVASRHWYSTATIAMKGGPSSRGQIVVGLPGHYSVRGDWFLAVAKGSRSPRLGERAMDILCSRRGNIVRLQSGLGLPVRDLFGPDDKREEERRNEYWTSLPYVGDDNIQQQIQYRELRKLGAFHPLDRLGRAEEFHWIWRSTINQYDDHVRIWQKWIVFMLHNWRSWSKPLRSSQGPLWPDGFAEYDDYLAFDIAGRKTSDRFPCHVRTGKNPRWEKFAACCDGLVEALERVGNPTWRAADSAAEV